MTKNNKEHKFLAITPKAANQLRKLKDLHSPNAAGIRLGVKEGGCNGMTYSMDFAEEHVSGDEVMELNGICVFIDPMSTMYLTGTEMDFVEENFGSSFVFRNPNETGRCGCGESFSI